METEVFPSTASAFLVSAPGKVIVFGEHAVVYGQPAIAAAISFRSYLYVRLLPESQRTVTLEFKDIGLSHTWFIDNLPWPSSDHDADGQMPCRYHGFSLDTVLLAAIKPFAESVSPHLSTSERKTHQVSATAFLYLFLSLSSARNPGFVYTLRSTIPIGAGLGSSASVCVCLSAALLAQANGLGGAYSTRQEQLERINSWAHAGELCIHGDSSGVDNTVSCSGKAIFFRKTSEGPSTITLLKYFPTLRLLLVNTKRPRVTAEQINKVKARKETHPAIFDPIIQAIGQITQDAMKFIPHTSEHSKDHKEKCTAIENLGSLFALNHGLLTSLGVSHPCLDRISQLTQITQIGWAKLTGAGGGGYAVVLPRLDVSEADLEGFKAQAMEEGFEIDEAILSADGIAMRRCARLESLAGKHCEDIDEEKFSTVDSSVIAQLVGLGGTERGEDWTFWCTS